jgi:ABC-type dipeptide/oligopeptide/nickel transport system permease component
MKRLLWMIPVLLGVTILIFTIMYLVPGDPVTILIGAEASELDIERVREQFGLNDLFFVQLYNFLKDAILHFDFGTSYQTGTSVTSDLLQRFPRTLALSLFSIIISVLVGIPLGVYAALHQNTFSERIAMILSLIGVSMPNFWLGMMLVIVFSLHLGWLPPYGIGGIQYYILPAIANSFQGIAGQARQSRSSVLEVKRADHVTTARSKGLSERKILLKHILPNSLIPVITYAGVIFGRMLGGTLIIETVFSLPGIGNYMIMAINNRDYPAVRGSVIFCALTFSAIMLLTDLLYAYVDPRIKARYVAG